MSIKKLFDQEKDLRIVSSTDAISIKEELESLDFVAEKNIDISRFVPAIDYGFPKEFAHYGLAEEYYEKSFDYIRQSYPYDGSFSERQKWHNSANNLDIFIFDKKYPRSTGYVSFSSGAAGNSGWSARSNSMRPTSYGGITIAEPTSKEYILIKGGPNTDPDYNYKSILSKANIYEDDKLRSTNLDLDFDRGVTVEFWYKGPEDNWPTGSETTDIPVIFDVWNGITGSSRSYGRMTIFFKNYKDSANPGGFMINCVSGTTNPAVGQINGCDLTSSLDKGIGTFNLFLSSSILDNEWHHYAFTVQNYLNNLNLIAYKDGHFVQDRTIAGGAVGPITLDGSPTSSGMIATIGASVAHPFATSDTDPGTLTSTNGLGWNKISGSIDEFRFWKVARTAKQIGRNFFSQVGGGTNTDINNVGLGVYYKFNEGISENISLDASILDYSGRITNGLFVGYNTSSYVQRNTGSAIVDSGYLEKTDPIIYSSHPDFKAIKAEMMASGSLWDKVNVSSMYNHFPEWVVSEDDGNKNLRNITQTMASYMDSLVAYMKALPNLRNMEYSSGSTKPIPFTNKKLESLGFSVYDLFDHATIIERFLDKDEKTTYSEKLHNIKNFIYDNIYNNLTTIYKSKGNQRSLEKLLHSMGLDEDLFKINLYVNDITYELKDTFRDTYVKKKSIDFNRQANYEATIYQWTSSADVSSLSYISGATINAETGYVAGERTYEANVYFPKLIDISTPPYRNFRQLTSSVFGGHTHKDGSVATDATWNNPDIANFQIYTVRNVVNSEKARFVLTSSLGGVISELTSSLFRVYNNEKWNLSFAMHPTKHEVYDFVEGATKVDDSANNVFKYTFRGYNINSNILENSFNLTGTISLTNGNNFLTSSIRLYAGAELQNFTGSTLNQSDVRVSSLRAYAKRLSDDELKYHAYSMENYGTINVLENIASKNKAYQDSYLSSFDTLLLNWEFSKLSGSDSSGEFSFDDVSSGSLSKYSLYGGTGSIFYRHYAGYGRNFPANSEKIYDIDYIPVAKQRLPEVLNSIDMVQILNEDDENFPSSKNIPITYLLAIEKSMYQTVSEEILNAFGTIKEFNNFIGHPVSRYRQEYKDLEKLRQMFFEKVENTPDIEKYLSFYKWFDSSINKMLGQFIPATTLQISGYGDTIESHILERNKVWNKFPTLENKFSDIEGSLFGINEKLYDFNCGSPPVEYWNDGTAATAKNVINTVGLTTPTSASLTLVFQDPHDLDGAPAPNLDGAVIILRDTVGKSVIFEFDDGGDGTGDGIHSDSDIAVTNRAFSGGGAVAGSMTNAHLAASLGYAINAKEAAGDLNVTASIGGTSETLVIKQTAAGTEGNILLDVMNPDWPFVPDDIVDAIAALAADLPGADLIGVAGQHTIFHSFFNWFVALGWVYYDADGALQDMTYPCPGNPGDIPGANCVPVILNQEGESVGVSFLGGSGNPSEIRTYQTMYFKAPGIAGGSDEEIFLFLNEDSSEWNLAGQKTIYVIRDASEATTATRIKAVINGTDDADWDSDYMAYSSGMSTTVDGGTAGILGVTATVSGTRITLTSDKLGIVGNSIYVSNSTRMRPHGPGTSPTPVGGGWGEIGANSTLVKIGSAGGQYVPAALFNKQHLRGGSDLSELEKCLWWKERAPRNELLASKNHYVNENKNKILEVLTTNTTASAPLFSTVDKQTYYGSTYALRKFTKPYRFDVERKKIIHGGPNFDDNLAHRDVFTPIARAVDRPNDYVQFSLDIPSSASYCECGDPTPTKRKLPALLEKYANNIKIESESGKLDLLGHFSAFSGSSIGGYKSGFPASARIKVISATPADYESGDQTAFTLVSADGTTRTYQFAVGGALDTGDQLSAGSATIRIQVKDLTSQGAIATEVKDAIENSNGHSTAKLTCALSTASHASDTIIVTQVARGVSGNTTIPAITNGSVSELTINGGITETSFAGGVGTSLPENLDITDFHHDIYGPDYEVPMQGPFTEKYVGGYQYRHANLNIGAQDTSYTRPEFFSASVEAYKIKFYSPTPSLSEARPPGYWTREGLAKRPVNIKNIKSVAGINGTYAAAVFSASTSLNAQNGTELILTDASGKQWILTTKSSQSYAFGSAGFIGTGATIDTAAKAARALWEGFNATIILSGMPFALSPATYTDETTITLTQNMIGLRGNASIILPAHITANGIAGAGPGSFQGGTNGTGFTTMGNYKQNYQVVSMVGRDVNNLWYREENFDFLGSFWPSYARAVDVLDTSTPVVGTGVLFRIDVPVVAWGAGVDISLIRSTDASAETATSAQIYVTKGASAAVDKTNIMLAINGSGGSSLVKYGSNAGDIHTGIHGVTAIDGTDDNLITLVADRGSPAGSDITLAQGDGSIYQEVDFSGGSGGSKYVSKIMDRTLPSRDTLKDGSKNRTVFAERFSSPGGPETLSRGYLDPTSETYSVYNAMNYRNSIVRNPLNRLMRVVGDKYGAANVKYESSIMINQPQDSHYAESGSWGSSFDNVIKTIILTDAYGKTVTFSGQPSNSGPTTTSATEYGFGTTGSMSVDQVANQIYDSLVLAKNNKHLDITATRSTTATTTIKVISADPADYESGDQTAFTLVSTDGTTRTYQFANGGALANGAVVSGTTIRVQVSGDSTQGEIAAKIKDAIENSNGHGTDKNTKLACVLSTVSQTNDTITISQVAYGSDGNTTIPAVTGGNTGELTINGGITETSFSGGTRSTGVIYLSQDKNGPAGATEILGSAFILSGSTPSSIGDAHMAWPAAIVDRRWLTGRFHGPEKLSLSTFQGDDYFGGQWGAAASASYHKSYRNGMDIYKIKDAATVFTNPTNTYVTKNYDNAWVRHEIPRSDYQYSWIRSSINYKQYDTTKTENLKFLGHQPASGKISTSGSSGWNDQDAFVFLTSSDSGMVYEIAENNMAFYFSSDAEHQFTLTGEDLSIYRMLHHTFTNLNFIITETFITASGLNTDLDRINNTLGHTHLPTPGSSPVYTRDRILDVQGRPWASISPFALPLSPSYFNSFRSARDTNFPYGRVTPIYSANISHNTVPRPTHSGILFNGLMLERNGPYGYPIFKQIRAGDGPIGRYLRKSNTISIVHADKTHPPKYAWPYNINPKLTAEAPAGVDIPPAPLYTVTSEIIRHYVEPPLTGKYKPFKQRLIDSANKLVDFTYTHGNNLCSFARKPLVTSLLGKEINTKQLYDDLLTLYIGNIGLIPDELNPLGPDGPNSAGHSMPKLEYNETVFPKEKYTFLNMIRERTQYDVTFWKNTRISLYESFKTIPDYSVLYESATQVYIHKIRKSGRTTYTFSGSAAYDSETGIDTAYEIFHTTNSLGAVVTLHSGSADKGFVPACNGSIWPLDARAQFDNGTKGYALVETNIKASTVNILSSSVDTTALPIAHRITGGLSGLDGAGELQNDYCIFHNGDLLQSGSVIMTDRTAGTDLQTAGLRAACLYNRRVPEKLSDGTVIYGGDTLWEAGAQANMKFPIEWDTREMGATDAEKGSNHINVVGPFYESYQDWAADLRYIGKGYSIVPEFRISEHMEHYLSKGTFFGVGDDSHPPSFLSLTGANIPDSSYRNPDFLKEDFYDVYSTSDFLKYFEMLRDDHSSTHWPRKIKLRLKTLKKFLPYEGFYPATRCLQLATLFSQSYGDNISLKGTQPNLRTVTTPLFAPGILFNTIKSGLAVDYPVISSRDIYPTGSKSNSTEDFGTPRIYSIGGAGSDRTHFLFDKRLPFETILAPEEEMSFDIRDCEPHVSASINSTGSIGAAKDSKYTFAMHNFLASIPNFFLKGSGLTTFSSNPDNIWKSFFPGITYRMHVVLHRTNENNMDAIDLLSNPYSWGAFRNSDGSQMLLASDEAKSNGPFGGYSAGRDLVHSKNRSYGSGITLYDRPGTGRPAAKQNDFFGSSFGPPVAFSSSVESSLSNTHSSSYAPFTPPYYNGMARAIIDFTLPDSMGAGLPSKVSLEELLSMVTVTYQREVDTSIHLHHYGVNAIDMGPGAMSIPAQSGMQVSASLNLFQKVNNYKKGIYDALGQLTGYEQPENPSTSWVIQPKFECPVLDFSGVDVTLPVSGSGSVSQGMWHQFGQVPEGGKGYYISIVSPSIAESNSYYQLYGKSLHSLNEHIGMTLEQPIKMQEMSEILAANAILANAGDVTNQAGYEEVAEEISKLGKNPTTTFGNIKDGLEISEAVVAIPFRVTTLDSDDNGEPAGQVRYFTFPRIFVDYANSITPNNSVGNMDLLQGTSLESTPPATEVVDLVQKMKKYVIPPQFNFIMNPHIEPIVMYIFEFKHVLSKGDLSRIWQNLPPTSLMHVGPLEQSTVEISHPMILNNLLGPDHTGTFHPSSKLKDIRWMVFKVKQKSPKSYFSLTANMEDDEEYNFKFAQNFTMPQITHGVPSYSYNWPYDFFTMIEMIKLDAGFTFQPGAISSEVDISPDVSAAEPEGSAVTEPDAMTVPDTAEPIDDGGVDAFGQDDPHKMKEEDKIFLDDKTEDKEKEDSGPADVEPPIYEDDDGGGPVP